jgi:hypothetical protein
MLRAPLSREHHTIHQESISVAIFLKFSFLSAPSAWLPEPLLLVNVFCSNQLYFVCIFVYQLCVYVKVLCTYICTCEYFNVTTSRREIHKIKILHL